MSDDNLRVGEGRETRGAIGSGAEDAEAQPVHRALSEDIGSDWRAVAPAVRGVRCSAGQMEIVDYRKQKRAVASDQRGGEKESRTNRSHGRRNAPPSRRITARSDV